MSRSKEYQKLLNSKRWKELRAWKLQHFPLCERCEEEGFIVSAVDVHHIVPVESADPNDQRAMERLAFDPNNLRSLCIPCHIKIHQEMRSHSKEKVAENKERARERFRMRNDPNYDGNG